MAIAKKILTSTAFQIFAKLVTASIAIISLSILSRYLTPNQLADYGTIYSLLAIFAAAADMGIYTLVLKEMSANSSQSHHWYTHGVILRMGLALFFLSLGSLIIFLLPIYHFTLVSQGFFIAAIGTFFVLISGIISVILQYSFSMHYAAVSLISGKIISFFLILACVFWWHPSASSDAFFPLLWAGTIGSFCIFLLTFFFSFRFFSPRFFSVPFSFDFQFVFLKNLFFKTLPFGIAAVLSMLYFQSGMMSFRFLLSPEESVIAESRYFIVLRILEVLMYFPVFFMASLLPHLSYSFAQKNTEEIQKSLSYGFLFLFLLAFPIAGYLFIMASQIVTLLSPHIFLSSSTQFGSDSALQLASLALFFAFLNIFISYSLIAFGKQNLVLLRNVLAVALAFFGMIILVPHYSFMGAAFSTLFAECFIFLWGIHAIRKQYSFEIDWISLRTIMVVSACTVAFVFFIQPFCIHFLGNFFALLIETILAGLFFFFFLFKIGFFTPELKKIFSK